MRESMSEFVAQIIAILYTPAVAFFLVPFLMLRFLIKFIYWTHRRSRGGADAESLAEGIEESMGGIGNRAYYGRNYGAMRRSGMDDDMMRRERARHRW